VKPFNQSLGRRTVIKGAGLGLVAGGISAALPTETAVAAMEGGEIWSSEYWAKKGDVPLWMFRKRLGAARRQRNVGPVIGQEAREMLAKAAGATSDQNVPAFNLEHRNLP